MNENDTEHPMQAGEVVPSAGGFQQAPADESGEWSLDARNACVDCGLARLLAGPAMEMAEGEGEDHVEIQFKAQRRDFLRNPFQLDLHIGEFVIVEAEKGIDLGMVHLTGPLANFKRLAFAGRGKSPEFAVLRKATEEDLAQYRENTTRERETFDLCLQKIPAHDLPMNLVDVEYQFDRNRITFYFTAEKRVDFRGLVRDLAGVYRTRIELRQIGVRDEAKRIGGIGSCGQGLCCVSWLVNFQHISTQHARVQNLPFNPSRLSGQCGRLKCCLAFEMEEGALQKKETQRPQPKEPATSPDSEYYNEPLEHEA